jgi:hypothetical protein
VVLRLEAQSTAFARSAAVPGKSVSEDMSDEELYATIDMIRQPYARRA